MLTLSLVGMLYTAFNVRLAMGWSNGGYSGDPSNPNYGTHDWIAQHALDWLPNKEKQYILDNLATYLYGTELPDNYGAPDGIGDTIKHHIYYWSSGNLQDNASAVRAYEEYNETLNFLKLGHLVNASKTAGIMSHYIVDVAVFGHVMEASTDWGAEVHHSDYETYVNERTNSYDDEFNTYLSFDGQLRTISAYDAALELAYDTTFDVDGDLNCSWMDQNYNWSDPVFKDRCGESLNLAVNYLTDVLHTLYVRAHIYVDDNNIGGPWDGTQEHPYQNITSAIEHASVNDTIYVYNGTYYENVVVNKALSLVGEGRSNTIIDSYGMGTVVTITASYVTVRGFTIRNSGSGAPYPRGVYVSGSNGTSIQDNNITNNVYGILLDTSYNNTISNNIVTNNEYGICLDYSGGNMLRNNDMTGNGYNFAILGWSLRDLIQDIDTSNTVDSKPIYYWVNQSDEQVPLDAGYVALVDCVNITVRDLNLTNNFQGMLLAYTENSSIIGNNVTKSMRGIDLDCSSGNVVSCNNIIDSDNFGIYVEYSNGNNISDNAMTNNI